MPANELETKRVIVIRVFTEDLQRWFRELNH